MVSGTVEALERWYSRVSIKVSLSAPRLLCEKYRDRYPDLGPVSRKSRELFGPEKAFVKLRASYSVKLVFSYAINRSQIKIAAKFRSSRGLRFEDTKRIMSPKCVRKVSGLSRNRSQYRNAGLVLRNHSGSSLAAQQVYSNFKL